MPAARRKPDPEPEATPFEDYVHEATVIAAAMMAAQGDEPGPLLSRERAMIREAVIDHIRHQQALAKKRDRSFEPMDQNRFDVVVRALAIGVTKLLEAWEYTALNRAWPPEID